MQYKIVVDKQPMTNPSSEKKEYIIDIEELRVKGSTHDSLMFEIDKTYVIRRLKLSEYYVLSVLDEPIIEALESINIELFEGDNYIYLIDMQGNKFYAEYLIKNEFNDVFATRKEMNSAIDLTMQQITIAVNQKFTDYSTTEEMNAAINIKAGEITSSVSKTYSTKEELATAKSEIKQTTDGISTEVSKKVGKTEVISSINQSAEAVQINADKISLEGKQIDLTGDNINIKSTNFNVDENGNMTCKNANVSGTITSSNATITGGSIKVGNNFRVDSNGSMTCSDATITGGLIELISSNHEANFQITEYGGGSQTRCFSGGMTFENPSYSSVINITSLLRDPLISVNGANDSTNIHASYIDTPQLICPDVTPSSSEKIKKNITKLTKNATEIINNSDIYEYNLKTDEDTDRKLIGFVIGDKYRTPDEVLSKDGEAVRLYSITGILWKAVQELSARVEQLEKEVQHE